MPFDTSMPVLVVEPHAATIITLEDMLRKLGFGTVDIAADSTSAVELLQQGGPRLVIADLHLEPASGLHLLRTIRSDDKLKRSPFILSARTLSSTEATAIKHCGADCFLLKPFKHEVLRRKVDAALHSHPIVRPGQVVTPRKFSMALGRRFGHWA